MLKKNIRVEKVFIGSIKDNEGESANDEFVFNISNRDKLLVNHLSPVAINRSLLNFSSNEKEIDLGLLGKVAVLPAQSAASTWDIMNEPIHSESLSYVRLKEFASIGKEKMPKEIFRENQQYQLAVNYNFIGDYAQGEMTAKEVIKQVRAELPVGYTIKQNAYNFWIEEGRKLSEPIFEFFLKSDVLHDPLVNDDHIRVLHWATVDEIAQMKALTHRVNAVLKPMFAEAGIDLVDYKLEFGHPRDDPGGPLVLGDEFTPDGCRLWDAKTGEKLDKDRFRRDLGDVIGHYRDVARRIGVPL